MTPTTCPHCNTTAEWYPIPEAGLERCPSCFVGTRPAGTQPTPTKKTAPKTKAKT